MHSEALLLDLIGLIYDAAGDPSLWPAFLERLEAILQTPWCFFYLHDLAERQVDIQAEIGFDPSCVRSYQDYYAAKNPVLIYGQEHLWPGNVCSSRTLCPEDVFLKSEFHNDWAVPQGIGHGISATVLRTPSLVGLFELLKPIGAKSPEEEDIALLRALMPHM